MNYAKDGITVAPILDTVHPKKDGSFPVRIRVTFHTARHSFATVLKRAGANIAYISESLGHQDMKTTENYLASFEREEREKNAQILLDY